MTKHSDSGSSSSTQANTPDPVPVVAVVLAGGGIEGVTLDLIADPHGNTAYQKWVQKAITTPDKVDHLSLVALVTSKVGALPESFRINRGWTSRMATVGQDRIILSEVLWPSMTGTLGKLVSPADKGKSTSESSGPFMTDNRAEIIVNFRAGAPNGSAPADHTAVKVAHLTAILHGLLMVARKEPKANADNRVRVFGDTYWDMAESIGFAGPKTGGQRGQKFLLQEGLRRHLRDIADQLEDVPVGSLAFDIGASDGPQSGKRYKVVCPYDLRDGAPKVKPAEVGNAIRARITHMSCQLSAVWNEISALPFCPEGSHPAYTIGKVPVPATKKAVRLVMTELRGEGESKETYIFALGEPIETKVVTDADLDEEQQENITRVLKTATAKAS